MGPVTTDPTDPTPATDTGIATDADTTAAAEAVEVLPAQVRHHLDRGTHSVLVDAAALEAVRDRFDAEQAAALAHYLSAAQSENTLRAYRGDWVAFVAWCLAEGRRSLPADPVDVAVYVAAAAEEVTATGEWALSPATLERRAAAIAAVHGAHGLASPTRAEVVRLTLRGIRRRRRARVRRKRPVLLHTLEALLAELPEPGYPTGVARRRDALLLLAGFAGALRRSELAALRLGDVVVDADAATGEPLLVVHLGATKTDPQARREQQVALPRGRRRRTCAVCALAHWLPVLKAHQHGGTDAVRALLAGQDGEEADTHLCHGFASGAAAGLATGADQPLFPAVNRHGHLAEAAMSGRAVAEVVKRYAARAGLDPALFGGHSLRAGFATQAALGGAADREIMRQGRWSSPRTVHGYIRTANPLDDNAVTRLGL